MLRLRISLYGDGGVTTTMKTDLNFSLVKTLSIYDEKLNWTENRHLFRLLEIFFSGENEPASKPLIFVFTIY